MKFKLVKSNSCSSRLELAGTNDENSNDGKIATNLDYGQNRVLHNESFNNNHRDYKDELAKNLEHEETVRDMIYKLETKNYTTTTKPRIIESRCIEKSNAFKNTSPSLVEKSKVSYSSPSLTACSFTAPHSTSSSNIDQQNEYEEDNHILISSKTSEIKNQPTILQHENEHGSVSKEYAVLKPKIARNKNVDLALLAVGNKKNEKEKNSKGFSSSSDTESIFSQNDSLNEHTISNTIIKTSRNNNVFKMSSVDMVRHQDKINSTPFQHHSSDLKEKFLMSENAIFPSTINEEKKIKMVNWGTVGTINKEYIMNDNRLAQLPTKNFEDMEFEEFEVAAEHYDSLNSK